MAKASIHLAKAAKGGLKHNDRSEDREPDYLLPVKYRLQNEVDRSATEVEQLLKDLYAEAKENYAKERGQKLQAKSYVWEAVVNLNKEHTLEDVQRLTRGIEKETGFTGVQIAIHRDEGHINERGVPQYNLHAHITFFTLDRQTGKQLMRRDITPSQRRELEQEIKDKYPDIGEKSLKAEVKKLKQERYKLFDRARLSKLQDLTAEVLEMERGKQGSKAIRMEHKQYKEAKRQELAKVKDLKQEIADLRQELKANGANREDYARLEAENKQLKEKIKAKDLTIEALKEQIEDLRKDLRRDNAKDEKLEQYREIILDQEERIDSLIEQNKALEAKISPKEGQSMANDSKIDFNPVSGFREATLRILGDSVNHDRSTEMILREQPSDEIIKDLYLKKGRESEVKRGANKLGFGGEMVTVIEFDKKDFEEAFIKVKERESKVKKLLNLGRDLVNRFRDTVMKVNKKIEDREFQQRREARLANQPKDKSRSRGGMSRG